MTTDQAEGISRIRSYIQHNAGKSEDGVRALVQTGHDKLFGPIADLSEEQATFKPNGDEWSVLETLRHVVQAKRGVARICARLARGETPRNVGQEGEAAVQDGIMGEEFATLAQARAAAQAAQDELLAFIDTLSADVNLETRYRHFLFGDLNCREWAAFQRVHDGDHGNQIEKILAAEGFPPA